jgi:hypothetical protein
MTGLLCDPAREQDALYGAIDTLYRQSRNSWGPLACPFCGGRLLKDGRIHTLQQGWR